MKAASTVLTGGLGRRTERQRALILPTGMETLTNLAWNVSQRSQKPLQRRGSMDRCNTAPLYCRREHGSTCLTPCQRWGAAKSGWGNKKHATYSIALESYRAGCKFSRVPTRLTLVQVPIK